MGGEVSRAQFLRKVVDAQPDEVPALLLSFTYFFCLLACYYVLRPVRDAMAVAAGTSDLPWLFTATFVVMLIAAPIYGAVVAKLGRRRFVPLVYQVLAATIVLFWAALAFDIGAELAGRSFFVWLSVFNLFAVSVFWSFMSDIYRPEQAARLFGFIAAGGSIGALVGPVMTVYLAERIGQANLLIVALLLLEAAVVCAMMVERGAPNAEAGPRADTAVGGNPFAGFSLLFKSRYLAGIALWVAMLSFAGTMLYFAQADIVRAASDDNDTRTRIFATIDLLVGIATVLIQLLATGRLVKCVGVGVAAAILPAVFLTGFIALGFWPTLACVILVQAIQRTANFAVSNVAREALFTATEREGRFKAKNIIDGVVFRGADAVNGWIYAQAGTVLGMGLSAIAFASAPLMVVWLVLALALGRAQANRFSHAHHEGVRS